MRRTQVYLNRASGEITVQHGWPPSPSEGDRWIKPPSSNSYSREKHLERKVLKIRGWRLTYEDQDGNVKTVSTDVFRKWTDDYRAVPKKLREYVVLKAGDDGRYRLRRKKRPPKHHQDAYRSRKKVTR